MPTAIALRENYNAPFLRRLARESRGADQSRRLLAWALIYDGPGRGLGHLVAGIGAVGEEDFEEGETSCQALEQAWRRGPGGRRNARRP